MGYCCLVPVVSTRQFFTALLANAKSALHELKYVVFSLNIGLYLILLSITCCDECEVEEAKSLAACEVKRQCDCKSALRKIG